MATKRTLEHGIPRRDPPRSGPRLPTQIEKNMYLASRDLSQRPRAQATQVRSWLRELDLRRDGRGAGKRPETASPAPRRHRRHGIPKRHSEMEHREHDS